MTAPQPSRPHGPATAAVPLVAVQGEARIEREDVVAVEAPLEIRLGYHDGDTLRWQSIAVTMRTPGHDRELAAGFLLSEGIIQTGGQVADVRHEAPSPARPEERNVIRVQLSPGVAVDLARLERHFYTTSSCGVCGKASIEAIQVGVCPVPLKNRPIVPPTVIHRLPATLREAQAVFDQTGGLHAAALFATDGSLQAVYEDVGRHNALDKLIGACLLAGRIPLQEQILLVSGRASFELVQKALVAGFPILAAVGAPSSLAVELAEEFDLTLLGFVRGDRFNIYSGDWRIHAAT